MVRRVLQNTSLKCYLQAPELLLSRKFDEATDVWSFGCLIVEMWSGGKVCGPTSDKLFV